MNKYNIGDIVTLTKNETEYICRICNYHYENNSYTYDVCNSLLNATTVLEDDIEEKLNKYSHGDLITYKENNQIKIGFISDATMVFCKDDKCEYFIKDPVYTNKHPKIPEKDIIQVYKKISIEDFTNIINGKCNCYVPFFIEGKENKTILQDITDITLKDIVIKNLFFENVNFDRILANNIHFINCHFLNCNFYCSELSDVIFSECVFDKVFFTKATNKNVSFYNTIFKDTIGNGYYSSKFINVTLPYKCPMEGSFVAYKKLRDDIIAKLEIPADAKRVSSFSNKCRCDKAKVLAFLDVYGNETDISVAYSIYDIGFKYELNEIVIPDSFTEDRFIECGNGIHFFMDFNEAVNY